MLVLNGTSPYYAFCSCGRWFTVEDWSRLRFVGWQKWLGEGERELRDCVCGSTMVGPERERDNLASALDQFEKFSRLLVDNAFCQLDRKARR